MEPFVRKLDAKGPSLFLIPKWMEASGAVTAGFTGRDGGMSAQPWTSLNCGLHVGDHDQTVIANRASLAQELGWPFEAWTCAEQVHGSHVYEVKSSDRGRGRDSRVSAIQDADALMTQDKNVLLTSFYADCVPLYFYDPQTEVIALAHAGWKGTTLEIGCRTVEAMTATYGCKPEHIQAAIGPSIGQCCYEAYGPVFEEISRLSEELQTLQGASHTPEEHPVQLSDEGKAFINLKELNRQIMIKAGILPMHIEMSQWCTGCRTDLFFSHRTEGGKTGRMVSWIGMRREED